jgi:membrane-bound transcription factor site-1 protease
MLAHIAVIGSGDVVGVGGINEDGRISAFSSRGMTTWELPQGYGRMKPDIVALARNIRGSNVGNGCKTMSGTSVASPVVAGCVTLLASVVPEAERAAKLNPAFLKQLLMESSGRVGSGATVPGIFEQGVGAISLLSAFALLTDRDAPFLPHASIVPSKLDLTDCPYMWPYCTQPLYFSAQPIVVNMTVLNSQAVSSFLPADAPPRFHLANGESAAQDVLRVWFTYPESFWPWSGYFAVHLALRRDIPVEMLLSGFVELTLQTDDEFATRSVIKLPLRVAAAPTPPRAKRLLFDSFHNLRYPSGYFPRDNLEVKVDTLDWNGDHVHTNYRELYTALRDAGYYVEVLGTDWTCFDASRYGTLLLVDTEEEFFHEELQKLHEDFYHEGLHLLVLGEWYNAQVMREIKFYDENTAEWWTPETGGANLPALNQLLAGFGVALGDHVVKGEVTINGERIYYASGTTITKFPQSGFLVSTRGGSKKTTKLKASCTFACCLSHFVFFCFCFFCFFLFPFLFSFAVVAPSFDRRRQRSPSARVSDSWRVRSFRCRVAPCADLPERRPAGGVRRLQLRGHEPPSRGSLLGTHPRVAQVPAHGRAEPAHLSRVVPAGRALLRLHGAKAPSRHGQQPRQILQGHLAGIEAALPAHWRRGRAGR